MPPTIGEYFFLFYSYKMNKLRQSKPENCSIFLYNSPILIFPFQMAPQECFCNIHEHLGSVETNLCLSKKEDEKSWEEGKSPKLTEVSDTRWSPPQKTSGLARLQATLLRAWQQPVMAFFLSSCQWLRNSTSFSYDGVYFFLLQKI